jgi:hypothetical protein
MRLHFALCSLHFAVCTLHSTLCTLHFVSIESREEVSQHADFEQADLNQDPNVLRTIIRETHLTAIHGVGLGALELVQMKNKFAQLRQKPVWRYPA